MSDEHNIICLDGSHPRNAVPSAMRVWDFPFVVHDTAGWCWCGERHDLPDPPTMRVLWVEFDQFGVPLCTLHGKVGRKAAIQTTTVEQGRQIDRELREGQKVRLQMGRYGSWVHP